MGINKGILSLLLTQIYPTVNNAISILSKYGGSLWVADPSYVFTGSDGTGAAGEGSNAGYVRDLCATLGPELRAGKFNNSDGATFTNNADGSTTVTTTGSQTYAYAGWYADVVQGTVYEVATNANASSRWIYYLHTPGQTDYVNVGSTATGVVGEALNVVSVPTDQGTRTRLLAVRQVGPEFGSGSFIVQPSSIREVVGRPLFQPTTAAKPKLRRFPKTLGPELIKNGNFSDGLTNWTTNSGTAAIVSGEAEVTSGPSGYGTLYQIPETEEGASYLVTGKIRCGTVGSAVLRARDAAFFVTLGSAMVTSTVAQDIFFTFTATGSKTPIQLLNNSSTPSLTSYADNISVREVLEWTWAWVGDGTDDTLLTPVQPDTNVAETMGVAFWNTGVNSKPNAQHFINRRNAGAHAGQAIFQASGVSSVSFVAGMGSASTTNTTQPALQVGVVASLQSDGTVSRRFANGEQKGTDYPGAYSFATSAPIYLLSSQGSGGSFCDRPVFAAYYAPAMLPAAERLIVERAIGAMAGVKI